MKRSKKAPKISIHIVSLGCAKNLVDTEVMAGVFALGNFSLVADSGQANVYLINTCSFIHDARKEAESEIQQALRWKKKHAGRHVVVAGCMPQRFPEKIREQFPQVDLFLGLDDVPRAAELIAHCLEETHSESPISGVPATYLYDHDTPRLLLTPANFAYVKIAEGCDHRCTFCAIPAIRGPQRSRDIASVRTECEQLVDHGIREINLIAQDTTRYGSDRQDGATLTRLLRECDSIPGVYWLRLLYTHPRYVTEEFLAVMAETVHIVPYIDIPLQHINHTMLQRMGRRMSADDTRSLMDTIRSTCPGIAIRTTFLLGFPGETDAMHRELMEFVEAFRFDRLGVFTYSPEPGTPALDLGLPSVPQQTAEERRGELLELQQGISQTRNDALVDQTLDVLIEECTGPGEFLGRTEADAPDIDNCVHVNGPDGCLELGLIPVTITHADPYDLIGEATLS